MCVLWCYRAYRTPPCKSKRGGFKDTHADDLLAPVLKVCL
jgi:acetyl-CoA acyltransferase 1